jgi:hypothetical protein
LFALYLKNSSLGFCLAFINKKKNEGCMRQEQIIFNAWTLLSVKMQCHICGMMVELGVSVMSIESFHWMEKLCKNSTYCSCVAYEL